MDARRESTLTMDPQPQPRRQRTAAETREQILHVARELFYWEGIRATGVDRVAADAGVAPTTLYRLFASKDDLVTAYIEREDRLYREEITTAIGMAGQHPRDRILAIFDLLVLQLQPERCRGCPFQMVLTEFPRPGVQAHERAVSTKSWVRARLGDLTRELASNSPLHDPDALADALALLMEGAYASVPILKTDAGARRARAVAERLLGQVAR